MSKRKLTSKTKIIIAALTLSVFVIAGIVSLVLVLAANQQSITSNISVTYVSNNVSAEVTGKYWYTGSSKIIMGTTAFNASDVTRTETMSPSGTIELSTENNKVVFEYAFKNLSENSAFTIELTNSPRLAEIAADYNNMTERYYVSAVEVPVESLSSMTLSDTLNIQPVMRQRTGENDTVYIYVVASIANLANDAAYNGQFFWLLDYVSPANIETIVLNNQGGSTNPTSMEIVIPTAAQTLAGDVFNMPCLFGAKPTKDDKGFAGYFGAASEGEKYISTNGSPVHACDLENGDTIYAYWDDNFVVSGENVLTRLTETGAQQTVLEIPDEVHTIGANVFKGNNVIQEVYLSDTLERIGESAFEDCVNLREVNFNVTSSNKNLKYTASEELIIEPSAFKNCRSLASIELPNQMYELSSFIFSGCIGLTSVTIPESVSGFGLVAFENCYNLVEVYNLTNWFSVSNPIEDLLGAPNIKVIHTSASTPSRVITDNGVKYYVYGDEYLCLGPSDRLTTIATINDSCKTINEYAFAYCSKLTTLNVSENISRISEYSFKGCDNLEFTTYGNAKYLGNNTNPYVMLVKAENTSITTCEVNSNTKIIAPRAFNDCSSITDLTLPNGLRSVCENAFDRSGLTAITIPSTVTSVDAYAFANCSALASIELPATISYMGRGMFNNCSSLESVTLPNGTTEIGRKMFAGCTSLESVTIPSSVTSIEKAAFYKCTSLTSFTIPDTITNIGEEAFDQCSGLTGITIPNTVTSLGKSAFRSCSSLASVSIGNHVSGILAYTFQNCSSLTNVVIPDSVTQIKGSSFIGCSSLQTVTIGAGVTYIQNYAFPDNLSGVTFVNPNGWAAGGTVLSGSNMANASAARNYLVSTFKWDDWYRSDTTYLTFSSISNSTAYSVTKKNGVTVGGNLIIPSLYNGKPVTEIVGSAFNGCTGITSVTIPSSVTKISDRAFNGCTGLTRVNASSLYSWLNLTIQNDAANPLYYAHHLYIDGVELTEITSIPEGITKIKAFAFRGCQGLTSVVISNQVTEIWGSSFIGCSNLRTVTIGAGVTYMQNYSFPTGITSVTFVNPNGWKAGSTNISASDLSNTTTARNYLVSTYYWNDWTRSA